MAINMKDIILILSDQHAGRAMGSLNNEIATPSLDAMVNEGIYFPHAYCNSPLCVPSRMSFLTGNLPNQNQIFNNDSVLSADIPTIAHGLGSVGYKTVLVGRMHFKGEDQNHGFDKRLVGDITTQYFGTKRDDLGEFQGTLQMNGCLNAVGGGHSPVMEFDDLVLKEALRELKCKREKPLFIVIGFYSPHFPYACEVEDYQFYKEKLESKENLLKARTIYHSFVQTTDVESKRNIKAAYYGLISRLDRMVGELHQCVKGNSEDYVIIYTSDHGDQCGKRDLYGKQTLYEESIQIPLIICGRGILKKVSKATVSLIDLSETILEIANATLPYSKGHSFLDEIKGGEIQSPPIQIQQMLTIDNQNKLIEAVILHPFKLVREDKELLLFHLEQDIDEENNCCSQYLDKVNDLKKFLLSDVDRKRCEENFHIQIKRQQLLKEHGKLRPRPESARIKIPFSAQGKPIE